MIEGFGHHQFEQQAFMSREPKAQVVELWPCLEEDGKERLVMFKAYVPSASQLRELTEDTKKYTSQRSSRPHGCNLGSLQVGERWAEIFELEDAIELDLETGTGK